jgi:hypothetical protein
VLNHRFFEVDVLAGVHRVDGDLLVPMIGRGDDHGVDVGPREHLAIVARGEDVLSPELLGARQAAVVDVGDGDDLDTGRGEGDAGVPHALAAGADQRDLDLVIRGRSRARPGGALRLRGRQLARPGKERRASREHGGPCRQTDEVPPRSVVLRHAPSSGSWLR